MDSCVFKVVVSDSTLSGFSITVSPGRIRSRSAPAPVNTQLVPQLKQLRPGARIVSHLLEIPGTKPDQIVRVKSEVDGKNHVLFLWTAPP
ncbi:MAG: hypothetical protein FJ276_34290 [Planctomycetes bacterium]|nr:hypothetical protein [Planctomycetota bacterium]